MSAKYTSPDLAPSKSSGRLIVVDSDGSEAAARRRSRNRSRGHEARDWKACPLGYASSVPAAGQIKLMTKAEIVEEVKRREYLGITNRESAKRVGIKFRSQGQTNNCWACSSVFGIQFVAAKSGIAVPDYCPMSTSARLTNGTDRGGWCSQFIEGLSRHGINTTSEWPYGRFSLRNATPTANRQAEKRVGFEWLDLPTQMSRDQRVRFLMSVVLQYGPVPYGANFMRHAVCAVDPVIVDGSLCLYTGNSGYLRNSQGVTVFGWGKAHYDDACVPTSIRLAG